MKRAAFLATMKPILLKRRDTLRRWFTSELALRSRSDFVSDEADEAQDAESDEMFRQLAGCERVELESIERALCRMQAGQYGICEVCHCEIPIERIQALPDAGLCMVCQQDFEGQGISRPKSRTDGRVSKLPWTRVSDRRFDDDGPSFDSFYSIR